MHWTYAALAVWAGVAAAVASGDATAAADLPLVLVQQRAEMRKTAAPNLLSKVLPSVSEVVKKPETVLKSFSSTVTSLQAEIANAQHKSQDAIARARLAYEEKLQAQAKENEAIDRSNKKIAAATEELRKSNVKLRAKASQISKENALLEDNLQQIQSNLSLAQEFVAGTLEFGINATKYAPELRIIDELAERDEVAGRARLHEMRMNDLANSDAPALFQIASRRSSDDDDPQVMLASLLTQINDLQEKRHESELMLKEQFEKYLHAKLDQKNTLLAAQMELNSTYVAEVELQYKLNSAVMTLSETKQKFVQRLKGLRAFADALGRRPLPPHEDHTPSSFLQISTEKRRRKTSNTSRLSNVSELIKQPQHVIESMTSKVSALEGKISEIQRHSTEVLTEQRMNYTKELEAQRNHNRMIKSENDQIAADISLLVDSNKALRKDIDELSQENQMILDDLRQFQSNLSLAQEFTMNTLQFSKNSSSRVELEILSNLTAKDAANQQAYLHEMSLQRMEGLSSLSLLQLRAEDAPVTQRESSEELMESLSSLLEMLQMEHNASAVTLKDQFEIMMRPEIEEQNNLTEQQSNLTDKKKTEMDINKKLKDALTHVRQTNAHLLKRANAIRLFARRLAASPLPTMQYVSLLQVGAQIREHKAKSTDISDVKQKPVALLQNGFDTDPIDSLSKKLMGGLTSDYKNEAQALENFKAYMTQVKTNQIAEVSTLKAKYDQDLREADERNQEINEVTATLTSQISRQKPIVAAKRRRAANLIRENEQLYADVQQMLSNISVAQKFARTTLAGASDDEKSVKLSVIAEFDEQAKSEDEANSRERLLSDAVAEEHISMIQAKEEPKEMLKSMLVTLDALTKKGNETKASLKRSFEELMAQRAARRESLLESQLEVNATLQSQAAVLARLSTAVASLEERHELLFQRAAKLRNFATQLASSMAVPAADTQAAAGAAAQKVAPKKEAEEKMAAETAAKDKAAKNEVEDEAPAEAAAKKAETKAAAEAAVQEVAPKKEAEEKTAAETAAKDKADKNEVEEQRNTKPVMETMRNLSGSNNQLAQPIALRSTSLKSTGYTVTWTTPEREKKKADAQASCTDSTSFRVEGPGWSCAEVGDFLKRKRITCSHKFGPPERVLKDILSNCPLTCGTCKASCIDVQPPSTWKHATCESQRANTGNCAKRRAREWTDGYCAKTCGLCE